MRRAHRRARLGVILFPPKNPLTGPDETKPGDEGASKIRSRNSPRLERSREVRGRREGGGEKWRTGSVWLAGASGEEESEGKGKAAGEDRRGEEDPFGCVGLGSLQVFLCPRRTRRRTRRMDGWDERAGRKAMAVWPANHVTVWSGCARRETACAHTLVMEICASNFLSYRNIA